jgi:enediyne biosynthesis protein E4
MDFSFFKFCVCCSLLILAISCTKQRPKADFKLFENMPADSTGVNFINRLSFDQHFNIYTYRNFYNGGGVGLGDFNNDGLIDICFTANQGPNKLYLKRLVWPALKRGQQV